MIDLRIEIKNGRVVADGLTRLAKEFPSAVKRGLKRIAVGLFDLAFQWLSGPGAQDSNVPGGEYPVPIRTGHLIRSLDWLSPGQSKRGDLGTFTARDNEIVVFDAARYAPAVFLGLGSSSPYGPRDAIKDALQYFNHGGNIQRILGEEVRRDINKQGLG